MTRLLLKKVMGESALLFAACALMLFTFCWARVWIVCQFDLRQFEPILKQFKQFERFSPVPLEQFLTYAGSIAMTFQEPVLILCVVVWSISRGSDVVSGELGRGTLEMLLSQPISRSRLLATHAAVCIGGLASLCLAAWLGMHCGIQTNQVKESVTPTVELTLPFLPVRVPIPIGVASEVHTPLADRVASTIYLAPAANLFCLGFFLLALSSMCSCWDRYRWRTIGIVIGIYIVQLLLFLLGRATEFTGFCGYLSIFTLYQPDGMVQLAKNNPMAIFSLFSDSSDPSWRHLLGPLGMNCLLFFMGCGFYLIGWMRFRSRDLPAPL